MHIIVTGGGGFIGRKLVAELLRREALDVGGGPQPITTVEAVDIPAAATPPSDDARYRFTAGDLADRGFVDGLVGQGIDAVFHLAALASGGAEADFDLGMAVNLTGTMNLLAAMRDDAPGRRVVFSSTVAAFGGAMPPVLTDETPCRPQGSYGSQKAMCELLLNDYRRRGFVDGRALRLPTIVVREGAPNTAASSFMSNIIREPTAGEATVCPVPPETAMWVLSPDRVVDALIHAMELEPPAWEPFSTVNLPGMTVTVAEALDALEDVAGAEARALITFDVQENIMKLVRTWPFAFETPRALDMGFKPDGSFREIVEQHQRAMGRV